MHIKQHVAPNKLHNTSEPVNNKDAIEKLKTL